MKRVFTAVVFVSLVAAAGYWFRPQPALETAYCGERKVAVWNRLAQVREPVETLSYGQKVSILERRKEHVRVRTESGAEGWMDQKYLLQPELWQRGQDLRSRAALMEAQARATTKVATNVRAEAGRQGARFYQFPSGVTVEVLARQVAEWAPATAAPPASAREAEMPTESGSAKVTAAFPEKRQEDWLFVRGMGSDAEIAGWVLGRFLAMDYPAPLRDYAAGMRFIAWQELTATRSAEGPRATYVAAGVDGPEGQACDFTLLRVYSWNPLRLRYETAYVESGLCGRLPLEVQRSADIQQEALFRFSHTTMKGAEQREYRSRQNVVRRVRTGSR
jgi:hypothetical protein